MALDPASADCRIFEHLFFTPCLLPGKKSFTENNTSVSIDPQNNETIIFFNIDDQSNPDCRLRQLLWGKREGEALCDLIIFYARGCEERIICFTELKDNLGDLEHATEQVINTYGTLKQHLKLNNEYIAKAFICAYSGKLPKKHQSCQKKLAGAFGKDNFEHNGRANDLGKLLRGNASTTNKGRRR